MGASGVTPMSLSRRFLSLPEELVGCSLPPKVSGSQLGCVTLCIAHILESAVGSHPLPQVSLVRARWWGEEQPGSLFRPTLLTGDGVAHIEETELSPRRAIRMKYPVCVPPETLLEYFQDMKELTLDVIDRVTRKKYGKCTLDLVMESGNSVMTAEEKLVALRHENVLCEIRASESENDVLGYLAVNFNVQWDNAEIYKWRGFATKNEMEAVTSTRSELNADVQLPKYTILSTTSFVGDSEDSESDATEPATRQIQHTRISGEPVATSGMAASTPVSFSSRKMDLTDYQVSPVETEDIASEVNEKQTRDVTEKKTQEIVPSHEARSDFQRIHRLLEKGKALKRSMEVAVQEKELVNSYALDVIVGDTVPDLTKVVESIAWKDEEEARSVHHYASFGDKWNENSQLLSSSSSSSFQETQPQPQRDDETDKTAFDFTKPVLRSRNVNAKTRHEPVLQRQITEQRGSRLLQFAVIFDSVSTSRNVEWYSGSSDSHIMGRFTVADEVESGGYVEPSHVALHYVVPPQLTRVYPTDDKFERTIKRKLKGSRWLDNAPRLWADFTGNIHVFQYSSAENASDHFSSGYLIIETWLYASKGADRTLLGLSKLPLRRFAQFLRNGSPELLLRRNSEQVLPFVGVEGRFAVENPFTGYHTGFLRVRVCVGTAEQLLALATTIKAIIKLQGVVRGVLYRKRFNQLDDNSQVPLHLQTDPERTSIFVQTEESFEKKSIVDIGCDAIGDVGDLRERHEQVDDSSQTPPGLETDRERKSIFVQTEHSFEEKSVVDVGCDAIEDVDNCRKYHEQVDGSSQTSLRLETDRERTSVSVQTEESFEEKSVVDVGCDAIEDVDDCRKYHEQVDGSSQTSLRLETDRERTSVSVQTEESFEEKSVVDVGCDAMENVDDCREHHEQVDENAQTSLRLETDRERTSVSVQTEESFEEKSVVDVGCDAMENVDDCREHHEQVDENAQAPLHLQTDLERRSEFVKTEESKDSTCTTDDAARIITSLLEKSAVQQLVTAVVTKLSKQQDTVNDVLNPGYSESSHFSLQNDKLDLVYEMLREMHDSYFIKLAAKSVSVGGDANGPEHSTEGYKLPTAHAKLVIYDNTKNISDQCCSLPNSPISSSRHVHLQKVYNDENASGHNPTKASSQSQSVGQRQKSKVLALKRCSCPNSPISRHPSSHNVQNMSREKNIRLKPTYGFDHDFIKTSSQPQSIGRCMENKTSAFDGCITVSERTPAREIGEQKSYRETGNIRRSDTHTFKRRYNLYTSQVTAKEEHLSVQSLFAHDSETERISRIMQGSVNYWMKSDSSSSCDDEASDEEETDDDYCYF